MGTAKTVELRMHTLRKRAGAQASDRPEKPPPRGSSSFSHTVTVYFSA